MSSGSLRVYEKIYKICSKSITVTKLLANFLFYTFYLDDITGMKDSLQIISQDQS